MAQGQATKVKKRKKSVLKRAAQSRQRADVNRANRTRVRTLMRRLRTAITAGDATAAGNLLHPTMSAIDQAITKGVLHENTGNRYKSRLTLAFNGVKPLNPSFRPYTLGTLGRGYRPVLYFCSRSIQPAPPTAFWRSAISVDPLNLFMVIQPYR